MFMINETDKVQSPTSFPQMEEEVLNFWQQADIFKKSLAKKSPRGEYTFYDGPPFATGTPHYGHIVASIMKDVVPRYQTMRGFKVERKWGWDCHGLPIENIVEKELGTKTKKEIEDLGVGKFNDLCRSKVLTYVDEWKKVIGRLGRWADMDNAYKTMDLSFMDSIWWAFKSLWDKGLIYQDYRSMHVCPRCETTLSQSEVTEGYREIKDLSVVAKFELNDEPGTYVLAWTTTPWTLIGNVALAVGKEIEYLKVEIAEDFDPKKHDLGNFDLKPGKYIFSSEAAQQNAGEDSKLHKLFFLATSNAIKSEILKGADLIGKSYRPLFSYYAADEKLENRAQGWKIYGAEFVTTEEGTGVVHIAPAFGEDDMSLGKAESLPFVQHVAMDGTFKAEVKDFLGLHVKPINDHASTDIEIIKYLFNAGLLFDKKPYNHSYPHCWRCDTPLINYATSSWFVKVSQIKDQLLKNAQQINWAPDYIKEGRFGNWLEGARDWSISRQRFWASAMPIWECACGERKVLGSAAELEALSGQKIDDIHKDKIDDISFACEKCSEKMRRIPDVLDCWFESGSMPFAQLHYPFENKDKFEMNFPAQFIGEGVDQTRAWFYYLHVLAGGIFARPAYQNVMVNGIVLAEDGKKMSKRLNNYPDPALIMKKYGADALRAYLSASPVMQAENLNFSEQGVQESLRKNIMILWNVYKFYEIFAPETKSTKLKSIDILDRWILIKLELLISELTKAMEEYNLSKAMRSLTEFIDELSTWYLRRSRERFKSADEADKQQALATLNYVLINIAKLMAPFTPFIAETLWQKVSAHDFKDANRSVHLEVWPVVEVSNKFTEEMKVLFGIPVRSDQDVLSNMELVRRIVELGLAKRDSAGIKIRQMLSKAVVSGGKILPLDYQKLILDELNIQVLEFKDSQDQLSVELDTEITPELKKEGLKRELVRMTNLFRKDSGFTLQDRAIVYFSGADEELKTVLVEMAIDIKRDVLAVDLKIVDQITLSLQREVKVGGLTLHIGLEKNA